MPEMIHMFRWKNNPRRAQLYGRRCRVLTSGTMGTVLVEFENGERVTTSRRALKRLAHPEGERGRDG